jgi:hypothetical protein
MRASISAEIGNSFRIMVSLSCPSFDASSQSDALVLTASRFQVVYDSIDELAFDQAAQKAQMQGGGPTVERGVLPVRRSERPSGRGTHRRWVTADAPFSAAC